MDPQRPAADPFGPSDVVAIYRHHKAAQQTWDLWATALRFYGPLFSRESDPPPPDNPPR